MKELKKTILLSIPMILGNLSHVLYGVVDSIMVGQLGAVPLAASAFVNNVIAFPTVTLIGISSAISVVVAQAYGAKDNEKCGRLLWNSLCLMLIVCLITTLGLFALGPFLGFFKQPQEVLEACSGYYYSMSISIIFLAIIASFRKYSEGVTRTYEPMLLFGVGTLLNILFNWIFIFGKLGVEPMGLTGAGVGTVLSRACTALLFVGYILKAPQYQNFLVPFRWKAIDKENFASILKIGLPSGGQTLFEVGAFAGTAILMGWLGTQALAAHQIALNIATVTFMVALGLSFGVSVRVGEAIGKKDLMLVRKIGLGAMLATGAYMSLCTLLLIVFRHQLPSVYISDHEVITVAAQFLIVAAFFQLFDGLQVVTLGALRGMSDVNLPTWMTLFCYWGVGVTLAYALAFSFNIGAMGIWYGLATSLVVASVLLGARFLYLTRPSLILEGSRNQ